MISTEKYSAFGIGFSDSDSNSSKVDNFIIKDDLIKFEISYFEQKFLVELNKLSGHSFIGKATELNERFIVDIAAKVFFDNDEIFICGHKWNEDRVNYSWFVFIE